MSTTEAALQLEGLSKSFGTTRAVENLSLSVNPGEMVGFLGPNGAGKSTTLYMITGLVHPSAGSIRVAAAVTATGPSGSGPSAATPPRFTSSSDSPPPAP